MSEERPKVSDHWMILRCGVGIWNRWREKNANFGAANLRSADLRAANLWEADLREADLEHADLQGANLGGANLRGANLWEANLRGANLWEADLWAADLGGANLRGAKLRSTNLWEANLGEADLQAADFGSADLGAANLRSADLGAANLRDALLSSTVFHAIDLREVKGLEAATHQGPSPVSSQTLKKSQGQIPEEFLKGCGLEDWEILATKLHCPNLRPDEVTDIGYQVVNMRASSPIVPLSLFISYSHENQRFVEKLETRFDKDGIRYWRDVHDLKAGPIEAQVDRAIGLQRATLLVLSADSVESDWVESEARRAREVEKARRKGGEGKYVLCPIALDDAWKTCDWPRRLREQIMEYNILDFSRWGNHEEFEKEYGKLKDGLGIYYANDAPGTGGAG